MTTLSEKLSVKKTSTVAITPTVETKLVKKTGTINLFENPSLTDMVQYLVKVSKKTMIEDGVNSIRTRLNTFWFDRLFQESHLAYLSSQYDKLASDIVEASKESLVVDIEKLQGVLTQKQIEHILHEQANSSDYTFEELKETMIEEFGVITNKVSSTLMNFRLI